MSQVSEQDVKLSKETIRSIAEEGGNLGIEIVDVAGHVEDVSARVTTQAKEFHALRDAALQMLERSKSIGEAAESARTVTRTMGQEVGAAKAKVETALADIRGLVAMVQTTASQLQELRGSLETVATTAASIEGIASHTNILAINASVEAVHAGARGAGFALIAEEVRSLSHQTRDASRKVDASLKSLATIAGQLAEASQQGTKQAQAVATGAQAIAALTELVGRATKEIDQRAEKIGTGAHDVEARVGVFLEAVKELDESVEASSGSLGLVSERLTGLLSLAERILGLSAETGVDTIDRRFVDLAIRAAGAAGALFDREVAEGRASLADLFDDRYQPIRGSNPAQFLTHFTAIADRLLPALLEPPLEQEKGVVFMVAVDRNGYLPTHNRKFSQPQRADPEWNKANCRNRRMFDDRVGLAAARNTSPFLIQCYRRDMGGGQFALMKDASAPIRVGGRHWGAMRVGYRT
jgi:methyl-accepting chemotaxis protein